MIIFMTKITSLRLEAIERSWEIIDLCNDALFSHYNELTQNQIESFLKEMTAQCKVLAKLANNDYID